MSEGKLPKFLDLDELGGNAAVSIKLNGKDHPLEEMSVEDFIWSQKELAKLENLEKEGKGNDEIAFERNIEIIARQFPTASVEDFRQLKMSQLTALTDFITTQATEGAPAAISDLPDGAVAEVEEGVDDLGK
tara:strand:- start:297 stop:692 length:396 start_codon:yes stop_codon:yes gene_type:complete